MQLNKTTYKIFLFFISLLVSASSFSQVIEDTTERVIYAAVSISGPALFFHPQTNGTLDVRFPYISKDMSGTIKGQAFHATRTNLFSPTTFKMGFINGEVGSSKNYVSVNLSLIIRKDICFDFMLGYVHSIDFDEHFHFVSKKSEKTKVFSIKPGVSFGYSDYTSQSIGSINGKGLYVNILGNTSSPTFITNAKFGHTTNTTNSIDVSYIQSNWSIIPKLTCSIYPFNTGLYFDFYVAYFIPVYEIGYIQLDQNDGAQSTKSFATEKLNKQNLSVYFNNTKSSTYSYKFNGFQVGVNIGFYGEIRHKPKRKTDVYGNPIKWYDREPR